MYTSPVEIIYNEIQYQVVEEFESQIVKAVQSYDINVDKEELVKALNYDRNQYQKGYADAKAEQPEIIRCKDCKFCARGIDLDGIPFVKCFGWSYGGTREDDFCSHAERRTDETN